jgi:hypothetical protein
LEDHQAVRKRFPTEIITGTVTATNTLVTVTVTATLKMETTTTAAVSQKATVAQKG